MSKMIDTENEELIKLFEEIQYCENIKNTIVEKLQIVMKL